MFTLNFGKITILTPPPPYIFKVKSDVRSEPKNLRYLQKSFVFYQKRLIFSVET